MTFSDVTQKLGLLQDCEMKIFGNYGDITNNTNRLYDFTARLNRAYDVAANLIMTVDGRWKWDDSNYTDFPIGQTNLVANQQDYTMDVTQLEILKVVLLDSAGVKHILDPFDLDDPTAIPFLQDVPTVTGIPYAYIKIGSSYKLYPTPNYNYTSGLIVHYQRPPSYFAYTDTTKVPGIPSTFHRILSLLASLDYAVDKGLAIKNDLAVQVQAAKDEITTFYSTRSKDEQKIIRPVYSNSR